MVVATNWTDQRTAKYISDHGVTVVNATPNLDALYSGTRVLIAPSLWPEAYGLVVMESQLRGIPVISSASGGLPEANVVPPLTINTNLYFDCDKVEYHENVSVHTAADEVDRGPTSREWNKELDPDEYQKLIKYEAPESVWGPYAARLVRLMEDKDFFKLASDEAYSGARKHCIVNQSTLINLLHDSDVGFAN